MSHRRAPRRAGEALRAARDLAAPQTDLASLQAAWAEAVGEQLAAVTAPAAERAGTVTVDCADSVWAQELDLMQEALLGRLREALGATAPKALRFRVKVDRF